MSKRRKDAKALYVDNFPPDLRAAIDELAHRANVPVRFVVINLLHGALERAASVVKP